MDEKIVYSMGLNKQTGYFGIEHLYLIIITDIIYRSNNDEDQK